MFCAQTAKDIDTISFAYDSPMHVSSRNDRVKIWLRSVNPFLPECRHKVTSVWPADLSVGDIRWYGGFEVPSQKFLTSVH